MEKMRQKVNTLNKENLNKVKKSIINDDTDREDEEEEEIINIDDDEAEDDLYDDSDSQTINKTIK
jgi:hypothetical protein